jgi:hypothetical protein
VSEVLSAPAAKDDVEPSERQPEIGAFLAEQGYDGLDDEQRLEMLIEEASLDSYFDLVDKIHRSVAPNADPNQNPVASTISNPQGEVVAKLAEPAERMKILQTALDLAKQVAEKYRASGGSIRDALRRCGNLLAFGVVLAHPYKDGNGRTSRVLGMLIQDGYDAHSQESTDDLECFSQNREGTKGFIPNGYIPGGEWSGSGAAQNPSEFLTAVAQLDVPLDDKLYDEKLSGFMAPPPLQFK